MKLAKILSLSKSIISGKAQLAQLEMSLSISNTLSNIAIRTAFKENGTIGYGVANVLVNRFINAFAFSTKLDATQIEILTVDTLEHFAYESLEDIILFFKMARSGKFGTTKKAPDSNLIFGEWFPKYLDLKAIEREKQYQTKKDTLDKNNLQGAKFVEKYLKKQQIKAEKEHLQKEVDELVKFMDRQMLEDTITSFEKDKTLIEYTKLLRFKRRIIK